MIRIEREEVKGNHMSIEFQKVGIRPYPNRSKKRIIPIKHKPVCSILFLLVLLLACSFCELFIVKDPTYMDLYQGNVKPGLKFWFGSDSMGRDIFSMIWYGGRSSLVIGILSTVLSTTIALVYGSISGLAPIWIESMLTGFLEIFISIPSLLLILFLHLVFGESNLLQISFLIGVTTWPSMAKVVQTEVKKMKYYEYMIAAKCMGASYSYLLWKHIIPSVISSLMFMMVMNVRNAIGVESTMSFMGFGLPLHIISWGSMLSLSEKAILSSAWWVVLIPASFLILTLVSITEVANYLRKRYKQRMSYI